MKHLKCTLGAVTAALAVCTFYTFALCMVEDLDDENIVLQEYITEDISETETLPAEEERLEAITSEMDTSDMEIATTTAEETVTETSAETVEKKRAEKVNANDRNAETDAEVTTVTTVPEEEEVPSETASRETDSELFEEDVLDDSSEALEQSVYGGYTLYEDDDDVTETEVPETETAAEWSETSETVETNPDIFDVYDNNDIVVTFFDGADTVFTTENTETSVSVNVGSGGDISTSETFTAKINGSSQTVNAYELICQIVANEMSPSFSDEAIKAQAVAAYSYVKYHNVNGLTPSVLVKKNVPDRIKELVSEVWGVCCYYNGSVAQTVYMASSSGYTADAENVWGGSVPYLKSVHCPFDVGNDPNYGDTMKVSEDRMRTMIESCLGITLSDNPYNWLVITGYVDGNYVGEISVDGQRTISGRKLRENVMGHDLKSAAFDVNYSDGYFRFTTYGYGHGVGMSQNGANILAKQGYSYVDILKYYFTGIEVI